MSLRKFGKNDVILNAMRTYPKSEFLIYDGKVYYNNVPNQSGSKNVYVRNVPPGYISLYEYNIDRQYVDTGRTLQTSDLGFLADGVKKIINKIRIYYRITISINYNEKFCFHLNTK